ncbi:hypothetical protein ACERII_04555 [Evansella sp. AB-rgal1]|uniref:hypothetical protein n=1 Tax=Evansella sp. AB-rgal1 TaxID=3242696 RepID=UPI00359D2F55
MKIYDNTKERGNVSVEVTILSLVLTFTIYNLMNVHLWSVSFNAIDYVLKPFMLLPFTLPLLIVLLHRGIYAWNNVRSLRFILQWKQGVFIPRIVEKRLPIYIVDDRSFKSELPLRKNTIVDMRLKNRNNPVLNHNVDVIKLTPNSNQVSIHYLIERANLMVKDTALKDKPITFLVDSKDDRNRMISKIWLRLIRNPYCKSAEDDIHTISKLVY